MSTIIIPSSTGPTGPAGLSGTYPIGLTGVNGLNPQQLVINLSDGTTITLPLPIAGLAPLYQRIYPALVNIFSTVNLGAGFFYRQVGQTVYVVTAANAVIDFSWPNRTISPEIYLKFDWLMLDGPNQVFQPLSLPANLVAYDGLANLALLSFTLPLAANPQQLYQASPRSVKAWYSGSTKNQELKLAAWSPFLNWGQSRTTPVGSACLGLTYPQGLDYNSPALGLVTDNRYGAGASEESLNQEPDLFRGLVESIRHTAPTFQGSTGGPLVNVGGQVIGVITDPLNVPVGTANSFNQNAWTSQATAQVIAQPVIDQMLAQQTAPLKQFLGWSVRPVSPADLMNSPVTDLSGLVITGQLDLTNQPQSWPYQDQVLTTNILDVGPPPFLSVNYNLGPSSNRTETLQTREIVVINSGTQLLERVELAFGVDPYFLGKPVAPNSSIELIVYEEDPNFPGLPGQQIYSQVIPINDQARDLFINGIWRLQHVFQPALTVTTSRYFVGVNFEGLYQLPWEELNSNYFLFGLATARPTPNLHFDFDQILKFQVTSQQPTGFWSDASFDSQLAPVHILINTLTNSPPSSMTGNIILSLDGQAVGAGPNLVPGSSISIYRVGVTNPQAALPLTVRVRYRTIASQYQTIEEDAFPRYNLPDYLNQPYLAIV